MLWLRYTAACAVMAAIGGDTGVSAAHIRMFGKRQQDGQDPTGATPTETEEVTTINELQARATPSPSETPDGKAPVCNKDKISKTPFCLPEDDQELHVDESYFVTWDPDEFPSNSTIVVGLSYHNDTKGKAPYTSDKMSSGVGFTSITMQESWLQEEKTNNLTVYIADVGESSGDEDKVKEGPLISLTHKPTKHYPAPPHTTFNKLGLMIGLPVGLGVFFLLLLGLCFGMRKKRQIGLGNIRGLRSPSRVDSQSKIDRLSGRRSRKQARSGAAIRMANMEEGEQYTDDPHHAAQSDTDRFNEVERAQGNAFQHGVSRLKSWR